MAAFGLAVITRSETRLAIAAVLWFVLHQKVRCAVAAHLSMQPLDVAQSGPL